VAASSYEKKSTPSENLVSFFIRAGSKLKKIAICGKGGSGKSVLTALLAFALKGRGMKVIVIDVDDSNVGLHRMLGLRSPPEPLIDYMGGKARVEKEIEARIKSGVPENLVNLFIKDLAVKDLPRKYISSTGGIRLVTVGKIHMALEGCACPMGIVSRSFLSALKLGADEVGIADMEAGVEHFGRGVETGVDIVLIAVEPSLDSLDVAAKIAALSAQINIGDVWAVISKAPSKQVVDYLRMELRQRGLTDIGAIDYDNLIFETCLKGGKLPAGGADQEIGNIVDFLFP
jgi:CO dehydrogenase maturation factor